MTATAVRARMVHRATVERNTQTDTNPHGHRGPAEWEPVGDPIACFLYYGSKPRESVQVERTVIVEPTMLIAPIGTDVTERDRINTVTDRAGVVVLAGVHNIRAVRNVRRSHVEIVLEGAR